jgi:hypothetical protein
MQTTHADAPKAGGISALIHRLIHAVELTNEGRSATEGELQLLIDGLGTMLSALDARELSRPESLLKEALVLARRAALDWMTFLIRTRAAQMLRGGKAGDLEPCVNSNRHLRLLVEALWKADLAASMAARTGYKSTEGVPAWSCAAAEGEARAGLSFPQHMGRG